jgi:XTP/dITP diphosphohydrolase
MRPILLGSGNPKKLEEIRRALRGLPFRILLPRDLADPPPPPVEDGATFEENAAIKAAAYSRVFPGLVLADDSGLEVDALGGRPGVLSARFAGAGASDARNNEKLLFMLAGIPGPLRTARFVCAVALAEGGRILHTARGTCMGRIAEAPSGTGGFGYDPLFIVGGGDRRLAELDPLEKDAISHRGRALAALRPSLSAMARGEDAA